LFERKEGLLIYFFGREELIGRMKLRMFWNQLETSLNLERNFLAPVYFKTEIQVYVHAPWHR